MNDEPELKEGGTEEKASDFAAMGALSFDEAEKIDEASELMNKVNELNRNFADIMWNLLHAPDVEDKPTAVRELASEFADRLELLTRRDPTKEKGFKEKVVNAVKKVVGVEDESPKPDVLIWKDTGGTYQWIGRYSNNIRDNDRPPEIISDISHRKFAAMVEVGLVPQPELWIWHKRQLKIGQSDWVAYDKDNGFAVAGGHFYPQYGELAEELKTMDDVKLSHGMPKWSIERDPEDDSIITQHVTEEISLLPGWAAANKRTGFVILE